MTDPRTTPDPRKMTRESPAQIIVPHIDLCREPEGPRDRQLVLGDPVIIMGDAGGWHYVQAEKDHYCGYVPATALGTRTTATHRVSARTTQAYEAPDIKSRDRVTISFGSLLTALSESEKFIETPFGHVPRQHVLDVHHRAIDPARIAEQFLGTPYLWGGNTSAGIDCSGLVQAAMLACHISCPGDSDLQRLQLGKTLSPGTNCERNDLIFWDGHVAIVTSPEMLIHANANDMAVAYEPIEEAIARIAMQEKKEPTAHKRL